MWGNDWTEKVVFLVSLENKGCKTFEHKASYTTEILIQAGTNKGQNGGWHC